ncbi:unnamed protein product [Orchesella dallaii]|uniref:Metalloendopeptidase n=1 Tax=Orchesella dallaii TaxID=48710 RepID=A0ABP1QAX9_9HEXA
MKYSIVCAQILSLISVRVDGTSDPKDCPSCQQDEPHEVPGEPLTPLDFINAEKIQTHSASENPTSDPMEQVDLFEGDIVMVNGDSKTSGGRNAVINATQIWPKGIVPYIISSQFDENGRSTIARAIMEYHQQTCISFKPRSNELDYIMFRTGGGGCSSPVGRVGGEQFVSLGKGCVYTGIIMHELLHAVGFWHEQSRWDRDDHVQIHYENIIPGMESNFRKIPLTEVQNLSSPYDTSSIMHYGSYSFSKNYPVGRTIVPKIPNENMGQRRNFTEIDIYKINKLYKCYQKPGNESSSASVSTTTPLPDTGKCTDNHKDCQRWASSGECQKNPNWMMVNCKYSCNQCRVSCTNNNKYCDAWANSGECSKNPEYMKVHCAKACKTC